MSKSNVFVLSACALALAGAETASASFIGQTILGPLGPNSVVAGDTTGANDDNDGFTSGDHFFFIWNGPDDAWQLNWPGGDLEVQMTYDPFFGDLDLFLYEPGSYDDSSNYSTINSGVENILAPGSAAGVYYIVIDGPGSSDAGPYTLSINPAPSTLVLPAMGLLLATRRRRAA